MCPGTDFPLRKKTMKNSAPGRVNRTIPWMSPNRFVETAVSLEIFNNFLIFDHYNEGLFHKHPL